MKRKLAATVVAIMVLTMAGTAFAGTGNSGFHHGNRGHQAAERHFNKATNMREAGHQQIGDRHFNNAQHHRETGRMRINVHHNNVPYQGQPGHQWQNARYYNNNSRQVNRRYPQGDFRRTENNQKFERHYGQTSQRNSGINSENSDSANETTAQTYQSRQTNRHYSRRTESRSDTTGTETRTTHLGNSEGRQFNPEQRPNAGQQSATEQTTDTTVTE